MASDLERFGRNVRKARDERAWTKEELAHRSDLSPVQISRIERGVREIRLSTLIELVEALEVAANALLVGIVPKTRNPPCRRTGDAGANLLDEDRVQRARY